MVNTDVSWLGWPGMRWEQFVPTVKKARSKLPRPHAVKVHFGRNELAAKGRRWLLHKMKADLLAVADSVRPAELIWSEVVPRFEWRGAEVNAAVEQSQRGLNFAMKKACNGMGWGFARHGMLTLKAPGYFEKDGVHLSRVGMAIFMIDIAEALEQVGCT